MTNINKPPRARKPKPEPVPKMHWFMLTYLVTYAGENGTGMKNLNMIVEHPNRDLPMLPLLKAQNQIMTQMINDFGINPDSIRGVDLSMMFHLGYMTHEDFNAGVDEFFAAAQQPEEPSQDISIQSPEDIQKFMEGTGLTLPDGEELPKVN